MEVSTREMRQKPKAREMTGYAEFRQNPREDEEEVHEDEEDAKAAGTEEVPQHLGNENGRLAGDDGNIAVENRWVLESNTG